MSDTGHGALAEALTASHDARSIGGTDGWTPVSDLEVFALAQVHATLALAAATKAQTEQLRVANLIASAALVPDSSKRAGTGVDGWAREVDSEIHSALADDTTWRALLGSDVAKARGLAS